MQPRLALFILTFATTMGIATPSIVECQSTPDVPSGTLAFFSQATTTCPEGWSQTEPLAGRLILATTSGTTAGSGNSEAPLGDREDRAHDHCYETGVKIDHKDMEGQVGGDTAVGEAGKYFLQGHTEPATSGLAFSQLLLCVRE